MWNLPAPLGFQGFDPNKPVTVYQRHLPHWRQDGATYFVTFRLADSLPQSKLDELAGLKAEWERRHAPSRTALLSRPDSTAQESRSAGSDAVMEELTRQIQERIERWLDQGMGSCPLAQASLAAFLTCAMHHFDDVRYELDCYVVMPNHAHVIVRPLTPEAHPLEDILGSWKKYSSRRINRELRRTEALWQEEGYDRIIRDEEHLWRAIQYIGTNPEKAAIPRESYSLWIRPQWTDLGWRFESAQTAQESRPT